MTSEEELGGCGYDNYRNITEIHRINYNTVYIKYTLPTTIDSIEGKGKRRQVKRSKEEGREGKMRRR